MYEISDLSTACAAQGGSSATKSYISELENLAKLTGKDMVEVLKSAISQIGHSIAAQYPVPASAGELCEDGKSASQPVPSLPMSSVQLPAATPAVHTITSPNLKREPSSFSSASQPQTTPSMPAIAAHEVNSPEVLRYVVEHIVKNEDNVFHLSAHRLRFFLAKCHDHRMKQTMIHGALA